MTNFITIGDREYNVNSIFNFGIIADDVEGGNVLEIVLITGETFEFDAEDADALYAQLLAVKSAAEADAYRLSVAIDRAEAAVAHLTQQGAAQ